MNKSVLKLITFSTLAILVGAVITTYIIYEQERKGVILKEYLENQQVLSGIDSTNAKIQTEVVSAGGEERPLNSFVLISESDTITFLASIDKLAKSVGVTLVTNELKTSKTPETGFDEISATFSLRGSQTAIEKMIRLLEILPYRSKIDSLTVTRNLGIVTAVVVMKISALE